MMKKLKILISKSELTQEQFAFRVGCKPQHITNMLKGRSKVTLKTLQKFAERLNIRCEVSVIFSV